MIMLFGMIVLIRMMVVVAMRMIVMVVFHKFTMLAGWLYKAQ